MLADPVAAMWRRSVDRKRRWSASDRKGDVEVIHLLQLRRSSLHRLHSTSSARRRMARRLPRHARSPLGTFSERSLAAVDVPALPERSRREVHKLPGGIATSQSMGRPYGRANFVAARASSSSCNPESQDRLRFKWQALFCCERRVIADFGRVFSIVSGAGEDR